MEEPIKFFNSFVYMSIEAIFSTVMNIRVLGARLTFLVLKLVPSKYLGEIMKDYNQEGLVNGILHLLRMKVSTYRQIGIKLSSLGQNLRISEIP